MGKKIKTDSNLIKINLFMKVVTRLILDQKVLKCKAELKSICQFKANLS
jgi:hypothetical protein